MTRFIIRRVALMTLMLVVSSMVVFTAMRVIPGDPTTAVLPLKAALTKERQTAIRQQLGLDKSIPQQYLAWLGGALHGDLGSSYYSGESTTQLIGQRIPATLELGAAGLLLGLLMSVPAAIVAAMRQGSRVDSLVGTLASVGISVPSYWLGVMLAAVVGVELNWLPARGYVPLVDDPVGNLQFLILPAVTLAVLIAATVTRYMRASLIEVLATDYVRTAQGKGLAWRRVVLHHAVPNASLPALNVVGLIVGYIMGGVVFVEFVFGWPGLGSLTVSAVETRDYSVLQGLVMLAIVVFAVASLLVDICAQLLDPRLRVHNARGGRAAETQ